MKSYKQFLTEEWKYNKEDDQMEHSATVRGHHVLTHVIDHGDHHELGFKINDSFKDKGLVAVEDSPAVARHVIRTIDDYVSKNKPKQLRFSAHNMHHGEAFTKYARYLAKKHGYSHKYGGPLTGHILKKNKEAKA